MNIRNNIDTGTFLIVIMQHNSYETWSKALDEVTAEVAAIIDFVTKYKIDGIQFSNLQPTVRSITYLIDNLYIEPKPKIIEKYCNKNYS